MPVSSVAHDLSALTADLQQHREALRGSEISMQLAALHVSGEPRAYFGENVFLQNCGPGASPCSLRCFYILLQYIYIDALYNYHDLYNAHCSQFSMLHQPITSVFGLQGAVFRGRSTVILLLKVSLKNMAPWLMAELPWDKGIALSFLCC